MSPRMFRRPSRITSIASAEQLVLNLPIDLLALSREYGNISHRDHIRIMSRV